MLTGYDADPGTAGVASAVSTTVNRVIGRVNAAGAVDTSTALTDSASANNVRSAASADGNSFYISGGAGSVRYVAALGATTSTQLSTGVVNLRQIQLFGGQLYASSASGSTRLATVGTNAPTTAGQTISNLPGITSTVSSSPYGFFFADLDGTPGIDTLYVADDTSTVGIQKYSLNAGTWTLKNAVLNGGDIFRGLTGYVSGSTVTLFATTPTKLVSITDSSGYNANLAGSFTTLATAATNTAFRGVALAPTP
ncbi:hypothetical protein MF271_00065 (plasmid) [Deinococcus sp. KNUC1210]|uniref:hypothetical protein n=1 Tax=Deinococcus sp. KNUC1210 TaxID=2917691 RepID=UPI001EEFE739|nr:hypothetical protein [Deinococcus sp. KNUC1210]ULH13877.1 hypothetical protein MF271_00065 [Deinococcus sp. KNUC1210]